MCFPIVMKQLGVQHSREEASRPLSKFPSVLKDRDVIFRSCKRFACNSGVPTPLDWPTVTDDFSGGRTG